MLNKKYFSNIEARLAIIKDTGCRIKNLPVAIIPIQKGLVLSYDQAGNEPRAIACLKESIFASKELLDLFLVKLNKVNSKIPKQYKKFIIGLAKGDFDQYQETKDDVNFLKKSVRFIHSLRELRNRLKASYSNIKIYLLNQKYYAKIDLNLSDICLKIPDYENLMQIKNYPKAKLSLQYYVDIEIEKFIEEQIQFWQILLDNSQIFARRV